MLICTKSSVAPYKSAPGPAPDSAGGAYSAPPDPLAGGEGAGCLLPKNLTSALGLRAFGLEYSSHRASIVHPLAMTIPPDLGVLEYTLYIQMQI